MTRFLRYAVERDRKLRAVLVLDGKIVQKSVRILGYDEQSATMLIGARKTPVTVQISDILSCDYARGDHGED